MTGGIDRIYNRVPLCPKHNMIKGNREIDLEKLRVEVALNGEMLVGWANELIDLDWAFDRAMEIFAIEYTRQHPSEQLVIAGISAKGTQYGSQEPKEPHWYVQGAK